MIRRRRRAGGFTLTELLIVVVIIGVLAAIALPKLWSAIDRAYEGRTFGYLGALRSAVVVCAAGGRYPPTMTDAGAPWNPQTSPTWNPPTTTAAANWGDQLHPDFARCIDPLPLAQVDDGLPFADGNWDYSNGVWQTPNVSDNPGGNYRGWHYCPVNGRVRINNGGLSTEGIPYSQF